jgi:hypothetical protein
VGFFYGKKMLQGGLASVIIECILQNRRMPEKKAGNYWRFYEKKAFCGFINHIFRSVSGVYRLRY